MKQNAGQSLTDRHWGLDLYRLLCMFLITSIHLGYTNITNYIADNPVNAISNSILGVFQLVGVNGFVLISSYFLSVSSFSLKRIVRFWIQILFCSILIFCVVIIFTDEFSIMILLKSLFPILTQHYWYPVSYLMLLIASPFLNLIIVGLDKKHYLILLTCVFVIEPVFLAANPFFDSAVYCGHQSHGIIWFISLYFVGGYIKKYGVKHKMLLGPISFVSVGIVSYVLSIVAPMLPASITNNMQLWDNNGLFASLLTVSLFITFSKIRIKGKITKKVLSIITPALFYVYLIQEHNSVRPIFWRTIEKLFLTVNNPVLISVIAFVVLLVFAMLLSVLYNICQKLFIGKVEAWICEQVERVIGVKNCDEYFSNRRKGNGRNLPLQQLKKHS